MPSVGLNLTEINLSGEKLVNQQGDFSFLASQTMLLLIGLYQMEVLIKLN